jgi:uncharacterized protein (UPF0297 family)
MMKVRLSTYPLCGFIAILMMVFVSIPSNAQLNVYYPKESSMLGKITAQDFATQLSKVLQQPVNAVEMPDTTPERGIFLLYDDNILLPSTQSCRVEWDFKKTMRFIARHDNGLHYGVYKYLEDLGLRFYLPSKDDTWTRYPTAISTKNLFRYPGIKWKRSIILSPKFMYKSWFIGGGYTYWQMDKEPTDAKKRLYADNGMYGEIPFNWDLYQRRNGMLSAYKLQGHKGESYNIENKKFLSQNPCYIAAHNNARTAMQTATPDINNEAAMQHWGNYLLNGYQRENNYAITARRNSTVAEYYMTNPNNSFRNLDYLYGVIGVDVADGAAWGNSTSTQPGCPTGKWKGLPYPPPHEQYFYLSNYITDQVIGKTAPNVRTMAFAYAEHADIPNELPLSKKMDVMTTPFGFQTVTSPFSLNAQWHKKHPGHIMEYYYVDLEQLAWGGGTPVSSMQFYTNTLKRIRQWKELGITNESSAAKFSAVLFNYLLNRYMKDYTNIDSSLTEFCRNMFGKAAPAINKLISYWQNDLVFTTNKWMYDNLYRLPLYLDLVNTATQLAGSDAAVQKRLTELKAFLHHLVLYYDFFTVINSPAVKKQRAETFVQHAAQTNHLLIINAYWMVNQVGFIYANDPAFIAKWTPASGTGYTGLAPLNANDIERNFTSDYQRFCTPGGVYGLTTTDYAFAAPKEIIAAITKGKLKSKVNISYRIRQTGGRNNFSSNNRVYIPVAGGSMQIRFSKHQFNTTSQTSVVVDSEDQLYSNTIIIPNTENGSVNISFPQAGFYHLSIYGRDAASIDLSILTKGNYFFKYGPFANITDEYYENNPSSTPTAFFVPPGIKRVYFCVNNAVSTDEVNITDIGTINKAFSFTNPQGQKVAVRFANPSKDRTLFCFDVPANSDNKVWKMNPSNGYWYGFNFAFSNIQNISFTLE